MDEYLHLDFILKKQGKKENISNIEIDKLKIKEFKSCGTKKECNKKKCSEKEEPKNELDIMNYLIYFDKKINKIEEIIDKYEKNEICENKDIILKNSIKQIFRLDIQIKKIKKLINDLSVNKETSCSHNSNFTLLNEKIILLETKLNGFDDFVKYFLHLNKKIKVLENSFHKLELNYESFDKKLDNKLDNKLDSKIDNKLEKLDSRIDNKLDSKLEKLDSKIDSKLDKLDSKIDSKLKCKCKPVQENVKDDEIIEGNFIIKVCNLGDREMAVNYTKMKSTIFVWASWSISDLIISKLYGTIKMDKIIEYFPKIKNVSGTIIIYNNVINTQYQGIIVYHNEKIIIKLSNRPIIPLLINCDVNINIDFKIQI